MTELHPHQQRVVQEKDELKEKMTKLKDFLSEGTIFNTLPREEKNDLRQQYAIMNEYLKILERRINRF